MKTILWLFAFLGFCGIMNAQETISSKELIGTWTHYGSNKPMLNDTIILSKNQNNNRTFSYWTFNIQDNELEKYARVLMQSENDSTCIIDVKSTGVKWAIRMPDLLVIKNHNDEQIFKISENTKNKIILVRIK